MAVPVRVLVVDDEPPARRRLLALLADRAEVRVVGEAANGREAVEAIGDVRPDLVFLDIQMPDLDGFGVLEAVGAERMPVVVFVTAYDEYALDAFDVAAVDYLLKPFDDERFEVALERALGSLERRESELLWERLDCLVEGRRLAAGEEAATNEPPIRRLAVERSGRTFLVPVAEVEWIEAAGHYVRLHPTRRAGAAGRGGGAKPHLVRDSLKRLESVLDPARFVRVHRSAIVQIDRVVELRPLFHGEQEVVLESGATVRLSRSYRAALERILV